MVSIREISDNNTPISSTRWAFASVIKFDIVVILITIIAYFIGHFFNKPFDSGLFTGVATLLGILTSLVATPKILQGFEPKNNKDKPESTKPKEEPNIVIAG